MVVEASTLRDESTSESSISTMSPSATATRNQSLWFPDGNIVLATNDMLFRVHKSMLSIHSSVFRDMFELAGGEDYSNDSGDTSNPLVGMGPTVDLYEGVPLVSLLDDEGVDVEELLLAVYDRFFYNIDGKSDYPLDTVLALLRLSTKYDFEGIRKEVITHIAKHYPTRLSEFEAVDGDDEYLFLRKRRDVHLPLLKAAVLSGIDDLFPSLYYACVAHHTLTEILDAFVDDGGGVKSTSPALRRLLEGREQLSKAIHIVMGIYVEKSEECLIGHQVDGIEIAPDGVCVANAFATHNLYAISGSMLSMDWDLNYRVCNDCIGPVMKRVDDERAKVWDELPSFFGLEKWDVVRHKVSFDNNVNHGSHVRRSSRHPE